MKLIFLILSVFQVSAQTQAPKANVGGVLAHQDDPELAKVKACLDRIAEKGALTTKDYATTGTDHFLFSSVIPKSVIYLGSKGIFDCTLNWPSNHQFSFTIEGQVMSPFGNFPPAANLTARECIPREDSGKMINQAQANLKYLGKANPKNCGEVKTFVKSACSSIPGAQEYVQKGCNDQGLPAGVTIQSGGSAAQ